MNKKIVKIGDTYIETKVDAENLSEKEALIKIVNGLDLIKSNVIKVANENYGNVSDGYHTFDDLYFHRMILFSVICKQNNVKSWRSKLHADGTMFEDYFIAGIETPEGQYTYHYHIKHWENFSGIKELEKAPAYDGHKPEDITRLLSLI